MADITPPAPTPGTQPIVGDDLGHGLPRHRENPARAQADSQAGKLRHSDQARRSRVDACARDLAAATERQLVGPEPLEVPLFDELARMTESNLAHELDEHVGERSQAVAKVAAKSQELEDAERRANEPPPEQEDPADTPPEEPATGRRGTHWALPLLILPILGFLEGELSMATIRVALGIDTSTARAIAYALAALMTISADLIGLAIGAFVLGRRRLARIVLMVLAVATAACLTWGVIDLGGAREHNKAYGDANKPAARAGARGFGSAGQSNTPAPTAGGFGAALQAGQASGFNGRNNARAPSEPDLGFAVPITLAALLAAAALAMRCTVAHPRQRWERLRQQTRGESGRRREAVSGARRELAEQSQSLDESDLHVAAAAEREAATLAGLIARFAAEYERACFARSVRPFALALPDLPDALELVQRLLDPDRPTPTQPVVVPTVVERGDHAPAGPAPGSSPPREIVDQPSAATSGPPGNGTTGEEPGSPHLPATETGLDPLPDPAGWASLVAPRHNGHGHPDDIARIHSDRE